MRNIILALFVTLLAFSPTGNVFSQQQKKLDREAILKASEEPLLLMPGPPLGYVVVKTPIVMGGKLMGFRIQLVKEGVIDKVLISIESRDLSERRSRIAATKAYINAFGDNMRDAGFKIAKSDEMPKVEKEKFKKPIVVNVEFTKSEDLKVFAQKRISFNKKGYDITILGSNKKEFQRLVKWAKQIKVLP